jgi:hypothetical protein
MKMSIPRALGVTLLAMIALPAAQAAAQGSAYFKIMNYDTGKCIDVQYSSTSNGATIYQWTCHGHPNQQWQTVPDWLTDGYSLIVARHSGKCMDVAGASTSNGAKVHQWTCHNGANQQWDVHFPSVGSPVPPNRRYIIRNRHSGKCLEPAYSGKGAPLRQWTCNGSLKQLWTIALP